MGPTVPGTRSTVSDSSTTILDLRDGLQYLNQEKDGIKFLKWLGTDGFSFSNHKHEWTETQLATREEVVTMTNVATVLTVANAYQYQKNTLLRCEDEVVRITLAPTNATQITVQRGYAGTAAVAHTAKLMYSIGVADAEGENAPRAINNSGVRLFNYDQSFSRAVALTNDEAARLSTQAGKGESPLNKEIEMRLIELHRDLARSVIYGRRSEDLVSDPNGPVYSMGGFAQFIQTNVYNVARAVTVADIDLGIYDSLKAGGDVKLMAMHPYQKQKLDALDANLVRLGLKDKRDNVGGNPEISTWKSGLMDHSINIVADWTFLPNEIHLYDTDYIEVGTKDLPDEPGGFHVKDSTPNGADRQERVIRGKFSTRIGQEKAHAILKNLS